jgi:hypothetical protein
MPGPEMVSPLAVDAGWVQSSPPLLDLDPHVAGATGHPPIRGTPPATVIGRMKRSRLFG